MTKRMNLNPEPHKNFRGIGLYVIPDLIREGMVPLSTAEIMEARLNYGKELPDWIINSFVTGDAIIRNNRPNGAIKLDLDSQLLRKITPQSRENLFEGALKTRNEVYSSINGPTFKNKEIEKYLGNLPGPTLKQAKENPIWIALARDKNLLKEYCEFMFDKAKEVREHGSEQNMAVFIDRYERNFPDLRPIALGNMSKMGDSSLHGNVDLRCEWGGMIGVKKLN